MHSSTFIVQSLPEMKGRRCIQKKLKEAQLIHTVLPRKYGVRVLQSVFVSELRVRACVCVGAYMGGQVDTPSTFYYRDFFMRPPIFRFTKSRKEQGFL